MSLPEGPAPSSPYYQQLQGCSRPTAKKGEMGKKEYIILQRETPTSVYKVAGKSNPFVVAWLRSIFTRGETLVGDRAITKLGQLAIDELDDEAAVLKIAKASDVEPLAAKFEIIVKSVKDASKLHAAGHLQEKATVGQNLKALQKKLESVPSNLTNAQVLEKEVQKFIQKYREHLDDKTVKSLQELAATYIQKLEVEEKARNIRRDGGIELSSLGYIPESELLPPPPVSQQEQSIVLAQFQAQELSRKSLTELAGAVRKGTTIDNYTSYLQQRDKAKEEGFQSSELDQALTALKDRLIQEKNKGLEAEKKWLTAGLAKTSTALESNEKALTPLNVDKAAISEKEQRLKALEASGHDIEVHRVASEKALLGKPLSKGAPITADQLRKADQAAKFLVKYRDQLQVSQDSSKDKEQFDQIISMLASSEDEHKFIEELLGPLVSFTPSNIRDALRQVLEESGRKIQGSSISDANQLNEAELYFKIRTEAPDFLKKKAGKEDKNFSKLKKALKYELSILKSQKNKTKSVEIDAVIIKLSELQNYLTEYDRLPYRDVAAFTGQGLKMLKMLEQPMPSAPRSTLEEPSALESPKAIEETPQKIRVRLNTLSTKIAAKEKEQANLKADQSKQKELLAEIEKAHEALAKLSSEDLPAAEVLTDAIGATIRATANSMRYRTGKLALSRDDFPSF